MKAWSCCALQIGLKPSLMSKFKLVAVALVDKGLKKTQKQENREFSLIWLHKLCLKTMHRKPVWILTNFLVWLKILQKSPK